MPKTYNRNLDEHLHILIAQGNYEAYQRLIKRYRIHAATLCREILQQYPKTTANFQDLMAICRNYFIFVVQKFDNQLSSFFSFWKEQTKQVIMDYLIENMDDVYDEDMRFIIYLDEEYDARHSASDFICEKDDIKQRKRLAFETRNLIARNEKMFSPQEVAILYFILDGYSISELEHCDMMKRSCLYLTFNSAIEKLQIMAKKEVRNRKKYQ